jgi:N-glycosylase/DNA lyase
MKVTYIENNDEVEISGVSDFDLIRIFECGQCFRWDADETGAYTGVAMGRVAKLHSSGGNVYISGAFTDFENIWRGYFDLDRDYAAIRQRLCVDSFMQKASDFGAGIRILRQDRWEALCSFIISQCNNIPRIKKIISALCALFGDRIEFCGKEYYTFPSAATLAALEPGDLAPIRCGYRAEYMIGAAKAVASGDLDLEALSRGTPEGARETLKKLRGVGNKVADCAVLFGLHMLDAFPVDVWMRRALAQNFRSGFDPGVFSPFAGVAQQYIFYYTRESRNSS